MDKITDITGINKYYCSKCNCFHYRKYKYEMNKFGKMVKTKKTPFFNHKEFAMKLTSTEIFNRGFKNSWKNYTIESHKQMYRSKKQ